MIVNFEQRKDRLIVSYINKEGNISYMQINIPEEQKYVYGYSKYKNNTEPNVLSWDKKPVRKIASDFLTKQRIQEFFIDAGDEITAPLFEQNYPNLYSCDIEVDVTDEGFSDPENANNRINTIAWTKYPETIVFGLKPLTGQECDNIEKEINNHISKLNLKYKFIYKQYENEANMIQDFLFNYLKHAPLTTGWNFWGYDWLYMYNRCKKLHIDISFLSPTKQWYRHSISYRGEKTYIMLPQHKLIVDYLEIYKKWDRTIDVKENNTLDFVAEAALGIKKVKYPGTLRDLYEKDYDKYVFYNAIDAILVENIHNKLKTMNTFLGLGNITRVEAMTAFSPINMLENTLARYIYKKGFVFPKVKLDNTKKSYEGAFVFQPKPDLYKWLVSLDFKSLYPSVIMQYMMSIENLVTKDKTYIPKENEIKSISGAVFDKSGEPYLPEILTEYFNKRQEAKKKSFIAEKEVKKLEEILKERKTKIKNQING